MQYILTMSINMITAIILQTPPPGGGDTGIDESVPIDQYTSLAFVVAISIGIYYFIKQKRSSKIKKY